MISGCIVVYIVNWLLILVRTSLKRLFLYIFIILNDVSFICVFVCVCVYLYEIHQIHLFCKLDECVIVAFSFFSWKNGMFGKVILNILRIIIDWSKLFFIWLQCSNNKNKIYSNY